MNSRQIQRFVLSYLDSTGCHIVEKSPNRITVKLSPEADRSLTNRPFYWSYVDRAGVIPETMTFGWSFDNPAPRSINGSAMSYVMTEGGRIVQEDVYFGSQRLQQLFEAVRQGGRCVTLFEEPPPRSRQDPLGSMPYTAWLGVNFKVSYECDMKREELYGWGISLATGNIEERFMDTLKERRLSPRLPSNIHLLKNGMSLRKGMASLESKLERKLKTTDFTWAEEAQHRLEDELERIQLYYKPMLDNMEPSEQKDELTNRFKQRESEINWQYRPRITLSVLNCGIFHLPGIQ